MKTIDHIQDINDLLIEIKARLAKSPLDKVLLIRECFVLWYILVEGISCADFDNDTISILLNENYETYQKHYVNDPDYCFIVGWMLNVAYWHIDENLNEEDGKKLLMKAYKKKIENSLFKWAVRNDLHLSTVAVDTLRNEIKNNFLLLYPFGLLIQEYFLGLI